MAGRKGRGGKRAREQEETALLETLGECLSANEIGRVLAGALLSLDENGRRRLVERLGEETGVALRQAMTWVGGNPGRRETAASRAKVLQDWKQAWNDWHTCVAESSEEGARYVVQDYDWEAPYLDIGSLAEDLDSIAERMSRVLPRAVEHEPDPGFSFIGAVEESVGEIGAGLPEWIDEGEWEGLLGPRATSCLLEWEWRAAHRSGVERGAEAAFDFLDRVRKADASSERWSPDADALTRFALGRDEGAQREMLSGIERNRRSERWESVLGSAHTGWFALYRDLSRRWAPSRHTEICRENISQDWELAIPLLERLLARKAYGEAAPIINETVRALLYAGDTKTWEPTKTLIVDHPGLSYYPKRDPRIPRFLRLWSRVAAGLGQDEKAHALRLQARVFQDWAKWDRVFKEIDRVSASGYAALAERLFAKWRLLVTKRSETIRSDLATRHTTSWVPLLVDAARAGDDSTSLHRALRDWLDEVGGSAKGFRRARPSLDVLVLDLDRGAKLQKVAPTLKSVLTERRGNGDEVRASRRRWLKRLDASAVLPDVLALWKRRAAEIVPSPADARGSRYHDCVTWLAIVLELDRGAYEKVVRRWKKAHGRRRNLWKEISNKGLPAVPEP